MNSNTPLEGVTGSSAQNQPSVQNSSMVFPLLKLVVIPVTALIIVGIICVGAILAKYPGVIEVECSSDGCRVVIDGTETDNR